MKARVYLVFGALAVLGISALFVGTKADSPKENSRSQSKTSFSHTTASSPGPLHPPTFPKAPGGQIVIPGRAVDVEARLRSAATAGDVDASFNIYLKLAQCTDSAAIGMSEQEFAVYRKAGVSTEALEAAATKLRSDCEGADQLIAQRGKWLQRAAEGGLKDAQLLYASDPDSVLGTGEITQIDSAAADAYAERSERYMTALAHKGDIDAMLTLSLMYKASQFTPQDPVRSAAYRMAAENIAPLQISPQPRELSMRGLDSRQQAEAMKLAREIQSTCCNNQEN